MRVLAYDGREPVPQHRDRGRWASSSGSRPQRPGHRVLNAADPRALTVAEIAAAVDAAMGVTSRLVDRAGRPHGRCRAHAVGGAATGRPRPAARGRRARVRRTRRLRGHRRRLRGVARRGARRRATGARRSPDSCGWRRWATSSRTPPRTPTWHGRRDGRTAAKSAMMTAMSDRARRRQPLRAPSTLPYGLPDHARIREEHYRPALLAGMAEQRAEIEAIATDPAPADRREHARGARALRPPAAPRGRRRSSTSRARTRRRASTRSRRRSPRCSRPTTTRSTSTARLFARVSRAQGRRRLRRLELEPDTAWLLHRTHTQFVRAGVGLDEASQDRLRVLNAEIRRLETAFGRDLLAATNAAGGAGHGRGRARRAGRRRPRRRREGGTRPGPRGRLAPRAGPAHAAGAAGGAARPRPARAGVPRLGRPRRRRRRTTRARPCWAWRASAPSAPSCSGTRTTRSTSPRTRPRRPPRPSPTSSSGWPRRPSPTRAPRPPTSAEALGRDHPGAQPRAVGLGVLRRAGQEGAALARRRAPAPVPGARARARRRGVPRRERAVRPDVRRAPRPRRLPPGRAACSRCSTRDGSGLGLFLGDFWTRESKRGGAWMNNLVDQSTLLDERPVVVNNLNIPKPPAGRAHAAHVGRA